MGERYAVVTVKRPPVVHIQVVAEANDENFQHYLDEIAQAFRRLDQFAVILNTGSVPSLPARYRQMMADWLARTQSEFEGRFVSTAYLIDSRVLRGVLMTLIWLNKPYYDYTVVSHEQAAWRWTLEQLAGRGISVPQDPEVA